jgi:hypothetical protein
MRHSLGWLTADLLGRWGDVTSELEAGAPTTLTRLEAGVGALQFSVATALDGEPPGFDATSLSNVVKGLAASVGVTVDSIAVLPQGGIEGRCRGEEIFLAVWVVPRGNTLLVATYTSDLEGLDTGEVIDAAAIVGSVELHC